MGSARVHYEGIKALFGTGQTEDLKVNRSTPVTHGDDHQAVPIDNAGKLPVKFVKGRYAEDLSRIQMACGRDQSGSPGLHQSVIART